MRWLGLLVIVAGSFAASSNCVGAQPSVEFQFHVKEERASESGGEREVYLKVQTVDSFFCNRLPADLIVDGRAIVLDVGEAEPRSATAGCVLLTLPAEFRTPLPLADGEYDLLLRSHGREDSYSLLITESEVTLTTIAASYTSPLSTRNFRAPVGFRRQIDGTATETPSASSASTSFPLEITTATREPARTLAQIDETDDDGEGGDDFPVAVVAGAALAAAAITGGVTILSRRRPPDTEDAE